MAVSDMQDGSTTSAPGLMQPRKKSNIKTYKTKYFKLMKKLILSLLVALGFTATASATDDALNLTMKNGTVHSFLLAEKPVITMDNGKLNVATDNATATYNLYDVSQYTFGNPTAIKGVGTSDSISRNGDDILFGGVDAKKVSVCTLDGSCVNAIVSSTANGTIVSLSNLPSGVYIVKADNVAIKINKK